MEHSREIRNLNIVIPVCGKGERFTNEGYSVPKSLVNIEGKQMIIRMLESLNFEFNDSVYIVYTQTLDKYR